ncbi:hypothetical protein D9M68_337750 [compost metagenome]
MLAGDRAEQDRGFQPEPPVADRQRDRRGHHRDQDAGHRQDQSVFAHQLDRVRPGGQSYRGNERGQPEVLEDLRRRRRQRAQHRRACAQPAENQSRYQAAAAGAQGQVGLARLHAERAEQHAQQHADAEEHEVGPDRWRDQVAQLRHHALHGFLRPAQRQHVAAAQHGAGKRWNAMLHARDALDVDAARQSDVGHLAQPRQRHARDFLAGEQHVLLGLHGVHAGFVGQLGADVAREVDHRAAPAHGQDHVAVAQDFSRRRPEGVAATADAANGDAKLHGPLGIEDGLAGDPFDAQQAAHQQRQRAALAVAHVVLAAKLLPQLRGGFAQVHPQQPWRELAGEQHDRHQAEQVGHAVRGDDIGLQHAHLLGRDAEPRDRFGGGADHRRFGGGTGQQACRRALVQVQQRHRDGKQRQQHEHFHQRQQADAPFAPDIGEELRTAGEAQRKDEHGKGHVLDIVVELRAGLPDHQRGDQRPADAAKLERAEADRTDRMADRERKEQCDFWLPCEQGGEHFHGAAACPRGGKDNDCDATRAAAHSRRWGSCRICSARLHRPANAA